MVVFKNYFKIAKKFLPTIIMYTVILTLFAYTFVSSGNENIYFAASKPKMVIINNDHETTLLMTFSNYISEVAELKTLSDTEENTIKDALFYRDIDYIIIIPENFTQDFLNGLEPKIETMKVPDSYSSTYSEMLLNRFLNIARVYSSVGMSEEEMSESIVSGLKNEANVKIIESDRSKQQSIALFYNFLNYILLALCIQIIATIMTSFNTEEIKKRHFVSRIPYKKLLTQLFLGNSCFVVLMWILYVSLSFVLFGPIIFSINGLLMIINLAVFCFACLGFGFLIGNLVKSREAQSGIVNVVALGTSFISGAFVSQEFLGGFVLGLARVFPSYYYIKNNNDLAILKALDFNSLLPIFINMIIVCIFGILFFIVTIVIKKYTLKKE